MNIGWNEALIVLVPGLVGVGFCVWVIVDVRRYSPEQFTRAHVNRLIWQWTPVAVIVACLLLGVVGLTGALITALIWRAVIRPQIVTA